MRKKQHLPNPYMDESPSRHGTKSERRIAKNLGGRETIGSGNLPFQKGDSYVKAELQKIEINFMIESKATIHESMSVKKAWLDKVAHEARMKSMEPALTVSFVDDSGTPRPGISEYVMITMDTFKRLTGAGDD